MEKQILDFESLVGFILPEDYRQFLLEYNGPQMAQINNPSESDACLYVDLRHEDDIPNLDWFDFSWWLGFADPKADYQYGLIEQYKVCLDYWRVPKGIIPIGGSDGPAKVFLNISPDERQYHVLLAGDRVFNLQAEDKAITSADFVSVATSFTDFLKKLSRRKPGET